MASLAEEFVNDMQVLVPGFRLVVKEDSRFMRFLARILFFNKRFLSHFITTIGRTVYVPRAIIERTGLVPTLAHEAQHYWDNRRWGLFYPIGYLSPQIWALGALLSLLAIWFSNWWLLCLLCLLLLAPLPALFRMLIERRGYLMSIACFYWARGDQDVTWTLKYFKGADYYWMWPFEKSLRWWFERNFEKIRAGKFPTPIFKEVHSFFERKKLLKTPN